DGGGSRNRVARGRRVCGLAGGVSARDETSEHPSLARGHCPSGTPGAGRRDKEEEKESRRESQPLVGIRAIGDRSRGGGGQAGSSRGGAGGPTVRHAHRRTSDDPIGPCRTGRGAGDLSG